MERYGVMSLKLDVWRVRDGVELDIEDSAKKTPPGHRVSTSFAPCLCLCL